MRDNIILSIIYALRLYYCTRNGGNARRVNKLYQRLISMGKGDSVVRSHINGQRLLCNFAHQLPFYQKEFPLYDRQLSKICHYLRNKVAHAINIIDIGANIGDTVLNIGMKDAFYLCIEGNELFAKLIQQNLKHGYIYELERCYLTDNPSNTNYISNTINGTSRLLMSDCLDGREDVPIQTLDQVIKVKYKNKCFDLIKIDTDGFDFKVIRGAKKCLQQWHPLLFFEWDKFYCMEQGEDPLSIFPILEDLGYNNCILFNNYGNLVDLVDITDISMFNEYIENTMGEGLPYYFDVLAVHRQGVVDAAELYSILSKK